MNSIHFFAHLSVNYKKLHHSGGQVFSQKYTFKNTVQKIYIHLLNCVPSFDSQYLYAFLYLAFSSLHI